MTTKHELCLRFAKDPGEDIYQIVEELVDLRTESCPCVYPSTKPCPRTAEAPNCIGLCVPHMKTKKGIELANLWNKTLEDLDVQESEDVEDESMQSEETEESSGSEQSEHSGSDEPEPVPEPTPVAPARKPASRSAVTIPTPPVVVQQTTPTKRVRQPRVPTPALPPATPVKVPTTPVKKTVEPNITVEKPPRVRKPKPVAVSEEESAAEGSAKAVYVEQEEEESPKPLPLVFKMGKFNNYVNDEHKFVLRLHDKTVLGTENKTGGIVKLTPKQIAVCKEHNLNYLE